MINIILELLALIGICFIAAIVVAIIKTCIEGVKKTTVYCGTEDRVEFFKEINDRLKLNLLYEVQIVDGEYEIVVFD